MPGVEDEVMPAVCPKAVQQSNYHPLLVPLGPLRSLEAGRVTVLAGFSRIPLLTAELSVSDGRGPRRITVASIHDADDVVASIDSSFEIRNGERAIFGRLESLEKQFLLREPGRALPRLAFAVTDDDVGVTATWHRSKQKLLSKLLRYAEGVLVATCRKVTTKEQDCYLEVRGVDGCDTVLMMLCAVALLWQGFLPGSEGVRCREAETGVDSTEARAPGVRAPLTAAVGNDRRDAA